MHVACQLIAVYYAITSLWCSCLLNSSSRWGAPEPATKSVTYAALRLQAHAIHPITAFSWNGACSRGTQRHALPPQLPLALALAPQPQPPLPPSPPLHRRPCRCYTRLCWFKSLQSDLIPACRELAIGIVAYSLLGK